MPTAGNAPPRPGSRRIAGRYLITGVLGRGAMGVVWSGYDENLRRDVAIKELTLPPGTPIGERADLRERMLREARTLGGLSHPNVITVYDVVEEDGAPFMVLELLVSKSLSAVVTDRGRCGEPEAAAVGGAVAAALRAVHRAGVTHRDVKPGNVLVASDGRIKLTDFGIARNTADSTITMTGLVLGSPAYIAPEVAAGGPVSPTADLWGLGATLFAAVEGRPPYDVQGDPMATITEVVNGPLPRLSSTRGPVAEVITGLMRKDPRARLPLTRVGELLRPVLDDPEQPRFPEPWRGLEPRSVPVPFPVPVPTQPPGAGIGPSPRPEGPPDTPPDGGAPLATEPGPLPGPAAAPDRTPESTPVPSSPPSPMPTPPSRPRHGSPLVMERAAPRNRRTALLAVPLLLLGALTVLAGAAGGWTVTRLVAGQSPLSTRPAGDLKPDTPLVAYTQPGGLALPVPSGWSQARPDTPANPAAQPVVRFVSADGAAELRVDKMVGAKTGPADPATYLDALTARRLGVDHVTVTTALHPVIPAPADELIYRTDGPAGSRAVWTRLVPRAGQLWVLQLSTPSAQSTANGAGALFGRIAQGFQPG